MYVCREDLSNLPFTTMCIRESLRLHSPVQAVTRKYTQDMALPGDRTVPQGERNRFLGLFLTTYSTTFVHLWQNLFGDSHFLNKEVKCLISVILRKVPSVWSAFMGPTTTLLFGKTPM